MARILERFSKQRNLATFANTASAQNISQIKLVKTGWGNINNAFLPDMIRWKV